MTKLNCFNVFLACSRAIREGKLIKRLSKKDKEFHFQDWFRERLTESKFFFDQGGRNSYPDFTLVNFTEGYEVKGLAYPGRESTYDSNSQVPSGFHNGRSIFYVFGRYPSEAEEDEYPVIDLVLCHGDFLNINYEYAHKNRNVKGFGSYGDILIRDRKMYVVPTPFALTSGTVGHHTLILPQEFEAHPALESVGELRRVESENLVIGYSFDLRNNILTPQLTANPNAGKVRLFTAYRARGEGQGRVVIIERPKIEMPSEEEQR